MDDRATSSSPCRSDSAEARQAVYTALASVLVLTILSACAAKAPTLQLSNGWIRVRAGRPFSKGLAVVVDPNGATWVAGAFQNRMQMTPARLLVSRGGLDGFVARYSPAGGLGWAMRFGGAGSDGACFMTRSFEQSG